MKNLQILTVSELSSHPWGGRRCPYRRLTALGTARSTFSALAALTLGVMAGAGCSSLKIVEGNLTPPKWVADPSLSTNYDARAYIYASGISTYSSILEEGINDARHDAIRKIAERAGVDADDIYRSDRTDKRSTVQSDMPNVPQMIGNSHAAVTVSRRLDSKNTRNPQATHTSQTRLHAMDEALLTYSVWQYGPSWWARLWYGDTAIRFYDVYVLMRCPKAEFESALEKERRMDGLTEGFAPDSKATGGN
jgi:hypothetical protein